MPPGAGQRGRPGMCRLGQREESLILRLDPNFQATVTHPQRQTPTRRRLPCPKTQGLPSYLAACGGCANEYLPSSQARMEPNSAAPEPNVDGLAPDIRRLYYCIHTPPPGNKVRKSGFLPLSQPLTTSNPSAAICSRRVSTTTTPTPLFPTSGDLAMIPARCP